MTRIINDTDYYDQLSKLVVEAIAIKLGWEIRYPKEDRSGTDISLLAGGSILSIVDIQCKATSRKTLRRKDGSIRIKLNKRQYDRYRQKRTHAFWVVLFEFESHPLDCITITQNGLRIDCTAYYADPSGWTESDNMSSVTVDFDSENRFGPEALESLVQQPVGG